MNQHEWVYSCYEYYLENYIEPGNPEDGEWHDCHYPTPACLGGTETVKLLKEHHAVQGVLQSEEFGHPCILGWEKRYLSGHNLSLYEYWRTEHQRKAGKARADSWTQEEWSTHFRNAVNKRYAQATPQQRSEWARNAGQAQSHEHRVRAARLGASVLNNQRWQCTVTGKVSTAGPLTIYQRARGIDPSNRVRLPVP